MAKRRKVVKKFTFDDLPHKTLTLITKYGEIEDVVSKERISKRFKTVVASVLAKKKTLNSTAKFLPNTNMMPEEGHQQMMSIAKVTSKMPQLRTITGPWNNEAIEELAKNNKSIIYFKIDSCAGTNPQTLVTEYIKAVKRLDPEYTAINIRQIFYRYPDSPANKLIARHPDLQLKYQVKAEHHLEYNHDSIGEMSFHDSSDMVHLNTSMPSVRKVNMSGINIHDLELFPNLETLCISVRGPDNLRNVQRLHSFLGNKVNCITLIVTPNITIEGLIPIIETLINIQEIHIQMTWEVRGTQTSNHIFNCIIQFLAESRSKIKKIKSTSISVENLRGSDKVTISRTTIRCDWNSGRGQFTEIELLIPLLDQFKKVTHVDLNIDSSEIDMDRAIEVCQQIVGQDHRRSVHLKGVDMERRLNQSFRF